MRWSELPLKPSERMLRQFAVLWILFFGGLATWEAAIRGRPLLGLSLAVLCLTVGPLGLWQPKWVRPIFVAWLIAAFPIGWLVSHLSLAMVYYFIITPLALIARSLGRDRLSLRRRPDPSTHWRLLQGPTDVRRYFRQY